MSGGAGGYRAKMSGAGGRLYGPVAFTIAADTYCVCLDYPGVRQALRICTALQQKACNMLSSLAAMQCRDNCTWSRSCM